MKEYKCKVMSEAMIKEIQELWDNGHAEAIAAYGRECANAGVEGYQRGYAIGRAIVLVSIGLGVATGYAILKIREKRALTKQINEFNEYIKDANKEMDAENWETPG